MNQTVKLRYDGKYDFVTDTDPRTWTIMSHWLGADGGDYYRSSRMLDGLKELGILQGKEG